MSAQKLSATVSTKSILIGDPIELNYSVITDASDSINFAPLIGEIPSRSLSGGNLQQDGTLFEIVDDFHDTIIRNGNKIHWKGHYTLTAWDSGLFVIPGPQIIIDDSVFHFKDLMVSCDLIAHDSNVDLYDIREHFADIPGEPFDMIKFLRHNWWWLSILLLTVIAYIIWKRRRREEPDPEPRISLKQRTLIAIEALENEKLWERDKLKEHFVELSYILRSYLTARYAIPLLEKTTLQTKLTLREKGLQDDTIDVINRILSQSDLVKFAKSKPESIEILKISALAKQVVAETSPLEIEDAE